MNHILPEIGNLPIAAIRKSHGEELKLKLRDEKKLKPKTANHVLGLAKKLLSDAVDEGLIDRNPWDRLDLVPAAEPDWDWLRPEELVRFIVAVRIHARHWLLEILLSARAGLRPCETAGLMVEDTNLETGELRVRRDVVRGFPQRCKSATSHRRLIAPSDLLAELRKRADEAMKRPEKRFVIDGREHVGHLYSVNEKGEQHSYLPETVERCVTKACKKAGLRRITYYDLRHTFASHLRLRGVPLEDIRDLLGHSSIQMTLRYAHIAPERFEAAARALEATTGKEVNQ
jgi:integrase